MTTVDAWYHCGRITHFSVVPKWDADILRVNKSALAVKASKI